MLIARYLPQATVVGEGDVLELAVREDGGGGEARSLTLDESLSGRHGCYYFVVGWCGKREMFARTSSCRLGIWVSCVLVLR